MGHCYGQRREPADGRAPTRDRLESRPCLGRQPLSYGGRANEPTSATPSNWARSPANADFVLDWAPREPDLADISAFRQDLEEAAYLQLLIVPPVQEGAGTIARQTTFVVDTSGSMAGASLRQAKAALSRALESLLPGDRFNIIEFNSKTRVLAPAPLDVSETSLAEAQEFVACTRSRRRNGDRPCSRRGLPAGKAAKGGFEQLLFITDGAVSNEDELFALIDRSLGARRLFTVGIGSAPNAHFHASSCRVRQRHLHVHR